MVLLRSRIILVTGDSGPAPDSAPRIRHERGIHALRLGAGGARVTEVVIVVVRRSLARRQAVTDSRSGRLTGKFVPFAGLTRWI